MDFIVLTGSRYFIDEKLMKKVFEEYRVGSSSTKVFVGDCKTGLDKMASRVVRIDKRFEADWRTYGKSAGLKRNSEMVEYAKSAWKSHGKQGRLICLAFFVEGIESRGTTHCSTLAENMGFEVVKSVSKP